jgi:hypothetical protein
MKKNLPILLGVAAAAGALLLFSRSGQSTGGGGGGIQPDMPDGSKPMLKLPRLAPAVGQTVTAITIDTNGLVREVIPKAWTGSTSLIELLVINASNGVPVAETIAFGREQYDFRTVPTEVRDLLDTYFNWSFA